MNWFQKDKRSEEERMSIVSRYVEFIVEARKLNLNDDEIFKRLKKNKCEDKLVKAAFTIADYQKLKGGVNMRFGNKKEQEQEEEETEEPYEEEETETEQEPAPRGRSRKALPQQEDTEIKQAVVKEHADLFAPFHIPERAGVMNSQTKQVVIEDDLTFRSWVMNKLEQISKAVGV